MSRAYKRRWSDNDKHFGPLTFAYSRQWRPFAIVLSSGSEDREDPGCCIRFMAFGATMICELPPIIKPWRYWQSTVSQHRLRYPTKMDGPGYWDEHPREYGFSLSDGLLSIKHGAQTHDSTTDQSWSWFLPWTQWRQIAHRIYEADGSLRADVARLPWQEFFAVKEGVSKAAFLIEDFDGEQIKATTYIEEREWRRGTGWFKWLGYLMPKRKSRSIDICFSNETGPEKGSWKGGTVGTGFAMLSGEMHEAAFRRYCDEEHSAKYRKYRVRFLGRFNEPATPSPQEDSP